MTCPLCFFKKTTQRELKENCLKLKLDRFEDRLKKYKELFIAKLSEMDKVSKCDCKEELGIPVPKNLQWFDSFEDNLRSNIPVIEEAFDELSGCYNLFLRGNLMGAHDSLWKFIEENQLISQDTVNKLLEDKLLFRGREAKESTENPLVITELFHIPFDQRELVSHGRFSISGQPMLYCGFSSFVVAKELDVAIDKLAMAAFLPKDIKSLGKIFGLTSMHETFSIIYRFLDDASVDYFDGKLDPNFTTLKRDITQTILLELCTFPRSPRKKENFTAEYVLPQILSYVLMSKDYKGIIYPSTKVCEDLTGVHIFSRHDLNIALFVDYDPKRKHDEKLWGSFTTAFYPLCKESEIPNVDISTVNHHNYNGHYDYLENSEWEGVKYFETLFGKTEIALHKKILEEGSK